MIRTQKLTQEEWEEIEVDLTDFEQRVCSLMLKAGCLYDPKDIGEKKLKLEVLGEDLFQELLNSKVKKYFFSEKIEKSSDSKAKKGSKKEKPEKNEKKGGNKKGKNVLYENFMKAEKRKKVEDLFIDMIKANNDALFRQKNFGFSSNILEFKLISFMCLAKIYKDREDWLYEIIIGLKKCLQVYESFKGPLFFDEKGTKLDVNVSITLIQYIKEFLDSLIEMNVFSMKITFVRYPKLLYHTIFDSFFENIQVKPYRSQREVIQALRNYYHDNRNSNTPRGLLIFYKAMIGSGKTTVSLALASMIKQLREKDENYKNTSVIFCCGLTQIRVQVGQLAYNSLEFDKVTFAVATMWSDGTTFVQRNHFSCKKEKNPMLYISDLETTLFLLKRENESENPNPHRYILFLDEPIIDADQPTTTITNAFLQIMSLAPNVTILSSATLPDPEHVPHLIGLFRKRYENGEVMTIRSEQAKIAQQIYINFNEKYYPHNGCKNSEELANVLSSVKINPFLAKLYSGPSLYHFEDKLKKMNFPKALGRNVEEKFSDPRNMNQKFIQENTFELFETLIENGEDSQIAQFCLPEYEESKIECENFKWEDLATKKAHLFIGGCLIAAPTPLEFARKAFGAFVSKVNLKALVKDYEKLKEAFDNRMTGFEEIKNEEERLKAKTKFANENNPLIQFPEYMKINLKAHLQKYSDLEKPELVGYRNDFLIEDLVLKIDEDLNIMLFSGVGVFDSEHITNEEYNKTIRNKAKFGELAYLISNKDILYGANYPLNNVIIDDDFVDMYSINTIFQTMGRAGRIGQAWKSNCYIGPKIQKKLDEYVKESRRNCISIEARNIEKMIIKKSLSSDIGTNEGGAIDIVDKMRKIAICFDINSLDGIFAMVSCMFYYLHKLENAYHKHLSDLDVFQIVKLMPSGYLSTISLDELNGIGTVYCLGVFPFVAEQNLNEKLNGVRKIIYIDYREYNRSRYNDFYKVCTVGEKIKMQEIFNKTSTCQLSYRYFKEKTIAKNFTTANFNPAFPSHVKKKYDQNFFVQIFEAFLKVVSEAEINLECKSPDFKAIVSYATEKSVGYLDSFGFCLKSIWKIATLKADIKLKAEAKHKNVLNKCNALVQESLKIASIPDGDKGLPLECFVINKIPISYYKYKSVIRGILLEKAISLNVKIQKLAIITWVSYQNKEKMLLSLLGLDKGLDCNEFAKSFGGTGEKNHAEMMVPRNVSSSWKFSELK